MTIMKPVVHLNGTSREALLDQLHTAISALNVGMEALVDAEPHGRDYYPIGDGAFSVAQKESASRFARVLSVIQELKEIQLHVAGVGKPGYPADPMDDVTF